MTHVAGVPAMRGGCGAGKGTEPGPVLQGEGAFGQTPFFTPGLLPRTSVT